MIFCPNYKKIIWQFGYFHVNISRFWERSTEIAHKIDGFSTWRFLFLRLATFQKGAFQPYYANSMLQNNVFAIWVKNFKKSQMQWNAPFLLIIIQSSWMIFFLFHHFFGTSVKHYFENDLDANKSIYMKIGSQVYNFLIFPDISSKFIHKVFPLPQWRTNFCESTQIRRNNITVLV